MADPGLLQAAGPQRPGVVKTAGWALIRDKVLNREYDASHAGAHAPRHEHGRRLQPMPLNVATIQNTNGQAITLHVKRKDRLPKQWKGFKFARALRVFDAQLPVRYYSGPSTVWTRTRTSRSASCRRRDGRQPAGRQPGRLPG